MAGSVFSCYPAIPGIHSFVTWPATMSHQRFTVLEKSVFTKDIKLITARLSGHSFQGFMRSFHSKCSLACHAVKWWVWVKTCVCISVSAPDICIYLYICILFVQINVSSDVPYSRETQKELVQFKSKWNISQYDLEFQLLVNCKYDLEKEVAHQGAKVCIYLLMLLLYYTVYCINNWNDSNYNLGTIQWLCMLYFTDTHFSELCKSTMIPQLMNTQW